MPRKPNPPTFDRARQNIMHYILSFCVTHSWATGEVCGSDGKPRFRRTGSLTGFLPEGRDYEGEPSNGSAELGDLVILSPVGPSKWTIGWLIEIQESPGGSIYDRRYAIRSLEDQTECWWSNVGISFIERDTLASNPNWLWSDAQYEFSRRWRRTHAKHGDTITRPHQTFSQTDDSVTLTQYWRYGLQNPPLTVTYPSWRKLTIREMADWAKITCAQIKSDREEQAAARKSSPPLQPDTADTIV